MFGCGNNGCGNNSELLWFILLFVIVFNNFGCNNNFLGGRECGCGRLE